MTFARLGPGPGPWVDDVTQLEAQAFGEGGLNAWTLVPLARHGRVYGLVEDGRVWAAAQVFRDWDQPTAYLVGIAVDQARRGQGWGTHLLTEVHRLLAADGLESLELTVDPGNTAAVRVYQHKLGYRSVEVRRDEYGAGEDRLVLVADLTRASP